MIFVYLAAIVVFVAIAVTIAVVSKKKELKRLDKFAKEAEEKVEIVGKIDDFENELVNESIQNLEAEKQPIQEDVFEDFSLEADEDEVKKESQNEIDDDELDRKFAEYQKFLRENLNMDDDDLNEDTDENDFVPPNFRENFDPNRMGKNSAESMQNIPPEMKEVLFSNPLARESLEQEAQNAQGEQENPEN